jgi:hypothetical protein
VFEACVRLTAVLCLAASATAVAAQTNRSTGTLAVTVVDQNGGVLPNAVVTVTGQRDATVTAVHRAVASNRGVATLGSLVPGQYTLQVEFSGFAPLVLRDLEVRAGEQRRTVTLRLTFNERLDVRQDDVSASLDRRGPTFSTVLTREMIDALPDDPDEMAAVLEAMAPPGATIYVDGFSGGVLPPKSLIKSIRVPRMDNMAAQYHGAGDALRIEIQTMPGAGPIRGRVNMTVYDDALSAQNPFTPKKGDEQTRQGGFSLAGSLVPRKASFSLNVGVTSQFVSPSLLAVLADGTTVAEALRRPGENATIGARIDLALNADHSLRVSYDRRASEVRNLGIGGFDLVDRAYRSSSTDHVIRLAESGPVGRRMFSESRLQLSWSTSTSDAGVESPTIRVIDAFTSGGAQVTGGQDAFELEASTDLDYVVGAHAWRVGALMEGGRYRSDDTTNYLGTWTFASLEAFNANQPSVYTRRIGDPNITYSVWQAGVYVEDDWRVSRNVLIAAGVRAGFETLSDDQVNLSPRLTIGWAPFGNAGLMLRGSYGYTYDWVPGGLYKQAQLLDGFRLRELNVSNPTFPLAPSTGPTSVTNRYLWSDGLTLPTSHRVVVGIEKKLTPNSQASGTYTYARGLGLLRGRNLNAPVDGVRPDPAFANIVELVSDAGARSHSANLGWSLNKIDWRRSLFYVNYTWTKSEANTTGAFSLPAGGDRLETEWGPAAPGHRLNVSVNARLVDTGNGSGLGTGLNVQAQSGTPYNITTGYDDNRDGVFSDRPTGVSRNTGRTAGAFALNGSVNYTWRFGPLRPLPDGAAETLPRYLVNWSLNFQNLTNRNNYAGYSGVLTSPFFGQPTNVANPRRLTVSMRFDF